MIITNLKDFKLRVAKYAKGTDDDDKISLLLKTQI